MINIYPTSKSIGNYSYLAYNNNVLSNINAINITGVKQFQALYFGTSQLLIAESAFQGMPKLKSFTVNNYKDTIQIGKYAFDGLKSLTTVKLPPNKSSLIISDSAFQNCSNLTGITEMLSSSNLTVGINAFSGCDKLTDLSI